MTPTARDRRSEFVSEAAAGRLFRARSRSVVYEDGLRRRRAETVRMDNVWLVSALWIGLALAASLISIWAAISVALIEIAVGAVAGNVVGLPLTPWVNYLAGFGAILLTFLAGTEVDADVVRRNFGASVGIGIVSFLA